MFSNSDTLISKFTIDPPSKLSITAQWFADDIMKYESHTYKTKKMLDGKDMRIKLRLKKM